MASSSWDNQLDAVTHADDLKDLKLTRLAKLKTLAKQDPQAVGAPCLPPLLKIFVRLANGPKAKDAKEKEDFEQLFQKADEEKQHLKLGLGTANADSEKKTEEEKQEEREEFRVEKLQETLDILKILAGVSEEFGSYIFKETRQAKVLLRLLGEGGEGDEGADNMGAGMGGMATSGGLASYIAADIFQLLLILIASSTVLSMIFTQGGLFRSSSPSIFAAAAAAPRGLLRPLSAGVECCEDA